MDSILHYENADGTLGEIKLPMRMITPAVLTQLSKADSQMVQPERSIRQFLMLDSKSQAKVLNEVVENAQDKAAAKMVVKSIMAKIESGDIREYDLEHIFSLGVQSGLQNFDTQRNIVKLMTDTRKLSEKDMALFISDEFWDNVNVEEVREIANSFRAKLRNND